MDSFDITMIILLRFILFFGILGYVLKFIYMGGMYFKAPYLPSLERKEHPFLFWIWIILLIYLAFFILVNLPGRGASNTPQNVGGANLFFYNILPKKLFDWLAIP